MDILRAYLPENDFGKMIAKNNYLATGREKSFGEWDVSHNGTMVILEALFGKTSYKKVRYMVRGIINPGVRQCLGFCSADS